MKFRPLITKGIVRRALTFLICFFGASGAANAVGPTEYEWLAWPDFCKAGFVGSSWSPAVSSFKGKMSDAQATNLRSIQETTVGIPGVHHFCMGMTYTNRAKTMGRNQNVRETLGNAINELEYSFSRMTPAAPRYSLVTAYYGTALYRLGKRRESMDMWNKGIEAKPASRESYLAMAEALLAEKKAKEALEVLLRYENAKDSDAPDAEAFLAHTYIELGMYEKAREHADKAYQFGYPLPGLRNKLARIGK
ncbi:tetratricopeptide repeat protein [Propionivibrio sp.]|uniref:tetratricopeptide repeat protein n=1 Tax=Propionivibrio sp. TaxID=2212460 RepID=UPI003BF24C01